MLKKFNYEKPNGSVSPRTVYVISEPSDKLLCLDLSEFAPAERDEFEAGLQQLHNEMLEGIEQLGLKHNWRSFSQKGIMPRKGV